MAQPSKVILVFCDGTGLDGILGLESVPPESLAKSVTNVLRLSRTVAQYRAAQGAVPRIPQIVYYQPGLGSQAGFDPDSGMVSKLLSGDLGEKYNQALGVFVASKIREAYTFIAQNYVAGDLICLFGFSRGSYTARKVAGIIDRIGILSGKDLYSFSEKLLNPAYRTPHPEVRVKFVGVWDTVGSVRTATGAILDAFSISDKTLPPNVDNAYHAVALQENRSNFLPTLWDELKAPNTRQVLEQVWFLGDHGDVGGGHQNVDLSDISLMWMAEKLRKFVDLDDTKLNYYVDRRRAAGWGNSQPFNAFLGLPRSIRMPLFTTEKRDELWNARKDVFVHASCDKAADPISRGYQVLRPVKDLPGFKTRKRAGFGGLEKKLSDSTRWAAANLDPKLVRQPDTTQDATAISFDETKRAGKDILSGDILGGGMRLAGGAIGTGFNFLGEMF